MKIQLVIVGALVALVLAQDGGFDFTPEIPSMPLPSDMPTTTADMNVDSLRDAVSHIDIAKIHDTMSKLPPQLQDMMAKAGIREEDVMKAAHNMSPQMLQMAASMAGKASPVPFPMPEQEEVVEDVRSMAKEKMARMGLSEDPEILIPQVKKMVSEGLKNIGIDADIEKEPEKAAEEIKEKMTKKIAHAVGVDSEDPEVIRGAIEKKVAGNLKKMGVDVVTDDGIDTKKLKKEVAKKYFPDVDMEDPESVNHLKEKLMAQMNNMGLDANIDDPASMKKAIMSKLEKMGIPAGNPEEMKGFLRNSMQHMMQSFMMQVAAHKMMAAQSMVPPPPMREMTMPRPPMGIPRPPMREMDIPRPPMREMDMRRPPMPKPPMGGEQPMPRFPPVGIPPINLEINVNIDPSEFIPSAPQAVPAPPRAQFKPHPLPPTIMPSYLLGAEEALMTAEGNDHDVVRHVMSVQSGLTRGAIDEEALKELMKDLLHYRMVARVLMCKNRMLTAQLESLEAASLPETAEFAIPQRRMHMPMMAQMVTVPAAMPTGGMRGMPAGGIIGKIMESMAGHGESQMSQSPLMAALMGAQQ
ncbi:hypothetical protein ScPMuIL_006206 [Solemya velum]